MKLNLAIIEDHEILRDQIAGDLRNDEIEVFTGDCGDDLNKILTKTPLDVVILDLNLPQEDGLEISKRIKAAHPSLTVVALTARVRSIDRLNGFACGIDTYITKPAKPEEIKFVVQSIVSRNSQKSKNNHWILDRLTKTLISPDKETVDLSQSEYLAIYLLAINKHVSLYQFQEVINNETKNLNHEHLENLISRIRRKLKPLMKEKDNKIIKGSWGTSSYHLCLDLKIQ